MPVIAFVANPLMSWCWNGLGHLVTPVVYHFASDDIYLSRTQLIQCQVALDGAGPNLIGTIWLSGG